MTEKTLTQLLAFQIILVTMLQPEVQTLNPCGNLSV